MPRRRRTGRANGATSVAQVKPEDFPDVDASCVERIISGEYTLETAVERRGPAPFGTIPSLEGCRSINVWGLSWNPTEEELRSLCSEFGTVADVNLRKSKADGGFDCATITFEKDSAAQQAQSCLQRTSLHGKVYHQQMLGCLYSFPGGNCVLRKPDMSLHFMGKT